MAFVLFCVSVASAQQSSRDAREAANEAERQVMEELFGDAGQDRASDVFASDGARYLYRIYTEGLSPEEARAFRPPNNRATICGRRDSRPRAGRFRLVIGINGRVETVEPVRPRNDAVTRCLLTLFAELRFDRRESRTSITLIVATRNNIRRAEDLGALGTLVEEPAWAEPGYATIRDHRPRPVFDRFRVRGVLNTRLVAASLRTARFECGFAEVEVALVVRDGRVASIRSNGNECVTRIVEQLRFENTPGTTQVEFRLRLMSAP